MFAPIKKQKVAEQVAASLRGAILSGRLKPSDAVPSERVLAERFDVNRSSIREALLRLESWGLIEIRQGEATRVKNFLESGGLQLLPYLIAPDGELDLPLLADLLEIRVMLLGWTAEQAAQKCSPEDISGLMEIISRLEDPGASPETRQKLDYDFFERLVATTKNRVLIFLSNAIRDVYMQQRGLFMTFYQDDVFDPRYYRAVVEALAAGDPLGAGQAMRLQAAVFDAGWWSTSGAETT